VAYTEGEPVREVNRARRFGEIAMLNTSATWSHISVAEAAQTGIEWVARGIIPTLPVWLITAAEVALLLFFVSAAIRLTWAAIPIFGTLFILIGSGLSSVHPKLRKIRDGVREWCKGQICTVLRRLIDRLSQKPARRSRKKIK
jgi:hypothetical protein